MSVPACSTALPTPSTRTRDLATLESLNTGKTIAESRWDMDGIAATFRYFAGLVATGVRSHQRGTGHRHQPHAARAVGVCGLIAVELPAAAGPPGRSHRRWARATPSSSSRATLTPLTTHRFAELLIEVGVPAGVFNLVTGAGEAGAELVAQPGRGSRFVHGRRGCRCGGL
ncbi:aldehyde dehydrogenase family protein [Cupriavidus basilensis]